MQLLPRQVWPGQSRCLCSQEFDGAHIRKLTAVEVQQQVEDEEEVEPRWIVCNGQVAGTGCAAMSVAKFRTTFIIFGLGQREFSRQFKVQH